MGNTLRSFDDMLTSAATNGLYNRMFSAQTPLAGTTAATTTCGSTSAQRYPVTLTIPSVGSGLSGVYFPNIELLGLGQATTLMCGLEYTLGTLTVSGNAFSAGVSMPTKTVQGTSVTTATACPMLYISTTLVATTPVITITYTNQAGTTGKTCSVTLPTNALTGSAFLLGPHLAAGDTGIRAVTGISTSAGTGGVMAVVGVLPLGWSPASSATLHVQTSFLGFPAPMFLAEPNEAVAFYHFGSNSASTVHALLVGVAD